MVGIGALLAELDVQRRHVVTTLNGLTPEQAQTPISPRTWGPEAAVHHLALDVERWWFQAVFADREDAWAYFEANPNGAWTVPGGTDVIDLYRAECATSDAIIGAGELDSPSAAWPSFLGPSKSLGEILLHVIGETAAHAGQLDVVREMIDGHHHLIID